MKKTDEQREYHVNNILTFMSHNDSMLSLDSLFEKIDVFMRRIYQVERVLFFSCSLDMDLQNKEQLVANYRAVWNKLEEDHCDRDKLNLFLKNIEISKNNNQIDLILNSNSDVFYYSALPCGNFDRQSYFMVCQTKEKIDIPQDLIQHLLSYIQTSLVGICKWSDPDAPYALIYCDDVTGLYNQRKLMKDLEINIRRYEENGDLFILLFIDLDYFKVVNDKYGHVVGTRLLRELGDILKICLRDGDLVYRYGGDEFVVLVPQANVAAGRVIGERILKKVKSHLFIIDEIEFNISVSIGIANYPKDADSLRGVLELADRMMYQAKNAGRGTVCLAEDFFK